MNYPNCPECNSSNIIRNGSIHNGKQKFACKDCNRQFVENPQNKVISPETRAFIDKLLLERISMAGIARVTGVSETWLQNYVNEKYESVPRQVFVSSKKKGHLALECDEMWSYCGSKENKLWLWFALDRETREIVGVYIGTRDRQGAQGLWDSLPPVYRQCAVSYTDFWASYEKIFPSNRHRPSEKRSGNTSHIERFNNTVRQRLSRFVRQTLSFSKKIENHMGAVWYFIHHYNASLNSSLS